MTEKRAQASSVRAEPFDKLRAGYAAAKSKHKHSSPVHYAPIWRRHAPRVRYAHVWSAAGFSSCAWRALLSSGKHMYEPYGWRRLSHGWLIEASAKLQFCLGLVRE